MNPIVSNRARLQLSLHKVKEVEMGIALDQVQTDMS
jgi:hypothetical protein